MRSKSDLMILWFQCDRETVTACDCSKDSNEGSSLALVSASMHVRNVGAHIDEHPELWNVIRDPMRKLRGEDVPEFDSSEKKKRNCSTVVGTSFPPNHLPTVRM